MQYLASLLAKEVENYNNEISRLQKEMDDIAARCQHLKKEINAIKMQISELNRRNVNTSAAVENINKILRDSGFRGFGLRAKSDDENVYEVIREDGSVAENLSEGERNFIAFLYFYHQVLGIFTEEIYKSLKEA